MYFFSRDIFVRSQCITNFVWKKNVNCRYGDQKEVNIQTNKVQMDPSGI